MDRVCGWRSPRHANSAISLVWPDGSSSETHVAPLLRMQGFFDEFALDLLTKDGKRLPAIANARERRDDAGSLLFTRLTILRAVDRRRYERELINARKQSDELKTALEERLRQERENAELREQFIAVLGHDLRNPLASIAAGARLMPKAVTPEDAVRLKSRMQSSVGRMAKMIESVMDLARGRLGGGISLSKAITAIEPVLDQVVAELAAAHPESATSKRISSSSPLSSATRLAWGSYSPICSATRSATMRRTSRCVSMPPPKTGYSNSPWPTAGRPFRRMRGGGCFSRSTAELHTVPLKGSVLASTSPPRSQRPTAARSRLTPPRRRPGSRSGCRSKAMGRYGRARLQTGNRLQPANNRSAAGDTRRGNDAGGYGEPVDMRGVVIAVKIPGRCGSMGQRRTARSKCSINVVLTKEGSYPPTSMAKAP